MTSELRRHCIRMGYKGWTALSPVRLMRFVQARAHKAARMIQRWFRRFRKKQPKNLVSFDLELLEEIPHDQTKTAFLLHEGNHVFAFRPEQLMQHIVNSASFQNPLTRQVIPDAAFRKLCARCTGMTFEGVSQTILINGQTDIFVFRREILQVAELKQLQSLCDARWQELLSAPEESSIREFWLALIWLGLHDAGRFSEYLLLRPDIPLFWLCFSQEVNS